MLGVWHHTSSLPVVLSPNRVASSVHVASSAADQQQQQSNGAAAAAAAAAAVEPGKRKKGEEKNKNSGRQIVQAWSKRPLINFSDRADESVSFFSHNCLFCSACHPAPGCPQFASLAQSASFCPRAPGSSPCLWPHSPQPVRLKTGDRF